MLASEDVLNVIGEERLRVLWQGAVFAAISGSFADSLPEPLAVSNRLNPSIGRIPAMILLDHIVQILAGSHSYAAR